MSKKACQEKHGFMHTLLAHGICKAAPVIGRLSDGTVIRTLRAIEAVFRMIDKKHPALEPVAEIREIYEESPAGKQALRNILTNTRPGQLFSLVRGALTHYTNTARQPFAKAQKAIEKAGTKRAVRIGLYGDDPESTWLADAYRRRDDCDLIALAPKTAPANLDAIEIATLDKAGLAWIDEALKIKAAISIRYDAFTDAKQAESVLAKVRKAGAPYRVLYPYFYFEPAIKIRELITSQEIGEVGTVRVRATVSNKGGETKPSLDFKPDALAHSGLDQMPLLAYFGGSIDQVAAYIQPVYKTRGGQALVDVKFTDPGRYGLLECTFAPEMFLRSAHLPYDLEAEITGTDGIIWLKYGMSRRTQAAPIFVRTGQSAYAIGIESGMQTNWSHVYQNCALEMIAMIHGHRPTPLTRSQFVSVMDAKEKARASNKQRQVI